MKCPLCQSAMVFVFDALILGRHHTRYFRCPECSLIKPENPYWLAESYTTAIAATDVGLVSRNSRNCELLGPILTRLQNHADKILDVGGGYGLLCRMLRDKGWDCYTMDIYCENLFAAAHEPDESFKCSTLLAFEVFEHIDDPLAFVKQKILQYEPRNFIFTTLTHHYEVPPQDWWYYTFETGQHISIYKRETLQRIAKEIGWNYLAISDEMHILTQHPTSRIDQILLARNNRIISHVYRFIANIMCCPKSRMMSDYRAIKERVVRSQSQH